MLGCGRQICGARGSSPCTTPRWLCIQQPMLELRPPIAPGNVVVFLCSSCHVACRMYLSRFIPGDPLLVLLLNQLCSMMHVHVMFTLQACISHGPSWVMQYAALTVLPSGPCSNSFQKTQDHQVCLFVAKGCAGPFV